MTSKNVYQHRKKQPQCEKPKPAGKTVLLMLLGGKSVSERNHCIMSLFAGNLQNGVMVITEGNYRAL